VINRLHFRLLAAFTLVILVTIGAVFFLINQVTQDEIRRFRQRVDQMRAARMEIELSRYFLRQKSWEGIEPFVEQWGNIYGQRIILTDASGVVVADSQGDLLGAPYTPDSAGRPLLAPWMGAIGTLYISPESPPEMGFSSLEILFRTIGRFFLWGGLVAAAIALVLAFFLSRRILAPVKALSSAARHLGHGDFSQRVRVKDKSELGELASTFNSMASNLERSERLRRGLVADVAHELRTPVSNIRGYLEAVRDGVLVPDAALIQSLNEETTLLSRLIDDLQELALADAGELTLIRRPEDIGQLIAHVVKAA